MSLYQKYPRTYHLPWSLGATSDDKILKSIESFIGKTVVVTEKMDGENTSVYPDYFHARSIDGNKYPYQSMLKKSIASWQYLIPNGMRICGENLYAEHSIHYNALDDYFLAFSVWQENICLSWDDSMKIFQDLGIHSVPVLYQGIFDEDVIKSLYTGISKQGGKQEGYIVRISDSFTIADFDKCVGKFVRKNHVQTDQHWSYKTIIMNNLA